jgi:serine/threonine-protein kinase
MALALGHRLGAFEVTGTLGAGGMGEVYRARDTKLGRDVALKVLPDAVSRDADRLARFQREAQVLASLNHPHIGAIYGFEDSADVHALVLELVEGPTLADRIAHGPLPLDEALAIARQIADALEAAHEQGIIHRDLKPANIKVTPAGIVKVLDFGLAKALEPASTADLNASASPTVTSPAMMTGVGMLLGTAAYMSPEQTKGKPADKRSDIWAFGCVLFEMLTGKRPFDGEDVTETLASVLKSEPNWNALPSSVPLAIRILLQRCLNKDRMRRVADVGTAAYVIDDAASATSSPDAFTITAGGARRRIRKQLLASVLAVGLTAIVVGAVMWVVRRSPPSPRVTRFAIANSDGQLTTIGRTQMAVSPDGTRLVYYRSGQAFLRDLAEFDAHALLPGVGQTAFSPDGRSLAVYVATEDAIKRMDLGSGATITVCRADNVFGMTWDRSGIISGQGRKGILRCALDGNPPEQLARVQDDEEADEPQILPDGKTLLFTIAKTAAGLTRWDSARIVVQSLTSGNRRTIVDGGSSARYVPSGHILYARAGVVFAMSFTADGEITGQSVAVVKGVRRVGGAVTGGAQYAVSDTGHLFYIPGPVNSGTTNMAVAVADGAGMVTRLNIPTGPYVLTRVSRDGARLAIGSDNGKEADIWTYRIGATGAVQRLTLGGRNRFPVWSPDGARVAFQSDREGDLAIFMQGVDGSVPAKRLTTPVRGNSQVPESWSPDGRYILVSVAHGSEFSLWTLSVPDGVLAPLGIATQEPTNALFSPDGKWIVYRSARPGVTALSGIFVQPFPPTGAVYPVPRVAIDFHPVWTPQGKGLTYVPSAARVQLATVTVTAERGMTFGAPIMSPATVTADRINGQPRAYDILPDGRLVGLVEASDGEASPSLASREIRVILNWQEELKRLVPTH